MAFRERLSSPQLTERHESLTFEAAFAHAQIETRALTRGLPAVAAHFFVGVFGDAVVIEPI
jgi:hypothetical protein